ncbi:MAG: redoxin domain-containing protein [Planctomycetaceae bacterium]|jgi:peroxiredoxin|nr:redoxin domain-containing protein [Planctomycetaceae bacterium]MBT6153834.1 redoxin domain-containing protein [Planctomycetaceae bacterium]MBT6486996.1 redoxin domain-containing protein [Planctomycetaceae bacterium]MBT6493102.1 redoxin domain-containing protein [Planctomycetaceae bacterium]
MFHKAVLVACALSLGSQLSAAEPQSPIGRTVTEFTLNDYRGKSHALADFKDEKLVVVAVLGTECPLAKLYAPRLAQLHAKYKDRGVAFLGINANRQDSVTEIAAHARVHKIQFPVLKDLGNKVVDKLGAKRTPEVFILDEKRTIRYWGRIDDQYGVGYIRDDPKRNDLAVAIDELLADKPVSQALTEAVGCHIGRVRQPKPNAEVTYAGQIAGILQKHCVVCHRPGEIAPFSLTDYDEVVGWGEMIAEVIEEQRMPPWHADPKHGRFTNARVMTEAEKKLVYRWVADGAPLGDASKVPPPRKFPVAGWQLEKKPDFVVAMRKEPFVVPAEGTVRYQYMSVDPGFKEDKWVQMAEIIPGNRAVVHHILVFVRPPKGRQLTVTGEGGFLVGYVPGMRAKHFPDGMAKLIPAGSQLVFQLHYTPIGTEQQDLSKVGFVFADPKDVKQQVLTTRAANTRFKIPAGDDNHRVEGTSRSSRADVMLLAMMPHMHLRGKSFRYEARFPDGKTEILLDVPHYDFNWQTGYQLAKPKLLPAGTRIHCVAHFDNSEDNLSNPDPTKEVGWGDQTWNEMMIGYFDVAVPVDPKLISANKKPTKSEPSVNARAKEIADKFDKNKNGTVEFGEVPDRLQKLFKRLDADKNDKLTVKEIEKLIPFLPR